MDEALLEKKTGIVDNENEHTEWVEYRLPGTEEIIHRSVNMTIKKGVFAFGEAAKLG